MLKPQKNNILNLFQEILATKKLAYEQIKIATFINLTLYS